MNRNGTSHSTWFLSLLWCSVLANAPAAIAQQETLKRESIQNSKRLVNDPPSRFQLPTSGGQGHRTLIGNDQVSLPCVVVRGTPYEMGFHLGQLMSSESHQFVPAALQGIAHEMHLDPSTLADVWARTSAYGDDRLEQELLGGFFNHQNLRYTASCEGLTAIHLQVQTRWQLFVR